MQSRNGFYPCFAFYLPQLHNNILGVRGIFIEGDKCTLKGDNSLLRRADPISPLCYSSLYSQSCFKLAHIPCHWEKVNGNPQKTGQFYIIWRAWQNCVFWRYMEVMTSNIDLFCHDCSLRISSCMNDIFALLYCDHPIKQFALCRRRTIKHYCMILSSMRASPIVDLTLTQLATTPQWWTKLIIRIAWMMSAPIKERPHQHQGGVCLFIY